MATSTYSLGTLHTTDAEFRTWGKAVSDALQAFSSTPGLVKTADTGQINWATVTRPTTSTDGGYEIYYLNDSIHGTSPIYLRVGYGTGAGSSQPRIQLTVGTGTNGAGTLTGTCLTSAAICTLSANGNATVDPSYFCVNTGFVGVALAQNTAGRPGGGFFICRTCDADGTPNSKGAVVVWFSGGVLSQSLRFEAAAAARTKETAACMCVFPQQITTGAVGANLQAFMCWCAMPDVRPIFGMCGIITANHGTSASFSVALVGTTARTYLALPNSTCGSPGLPATTGYSCAMLYE